MGSLKTIFRFYINSSIHVALAVACLCLITLIDFNLSIDWNLIFFCFFATISGYNFVRYFGLAKFHHRSLAIWLKQIQIFSFICFIPLGYFTLKLERLTIHYLLFLGLITFFYAIPFLPKSLFIDGSKNLRAISGLKIYVIAFVWCVVTVVIPLINEGMDIDHDAILTTIQRFLYVLIVMLPFEIRDMQYDSLKLSTIPQQIGVKQTKIIGVILLFIFFLLEFFMDNTGVTKMVILGTISAIVLWFLLISKVQQPEYYNSFFVEGIPVVWLLLKLI